MNRRHLSLRLGLGLAIALALQAAPPTSIARAAALPTDSSVAFQIDATHSGNQLDPLKPPLQRQWSVDLGDTANYPVIADGRLFITAGPLLYAFDLQTGTPLWGPIDIGAHDGFATYDGGRLFVQNSYNFLRAFDPATGRTLWLEQLPGETSSFTAPVALNGTIYAIGNGQGALLYAVRESDGALLWGTGGCGGCPLIGDSAVAVTSTGIYVDGGCGFNYRLDPASGNQMWGTSGVCSGGGGLTPAVYQDRFYSPPTYPNLDDIDVLDTTFGKTIGTFKASRAPAFSGSTGFFLDYGTLRAQDLTSGTVQWSFTGDGSLITSPIVANGYVYVGSSQGHLYAVDASSGNPTLVDTTPSGMQGEVSNSYLLPGLAIGQGMLAVPAGSTLTVYGTGPPPGPPGPRTIPPQTLPPPSGGTGVQTTFQVDATHSGLQSADTTSPPLGFAWARDFGSTPSTPLIAGGRVFIAADDPGGTNALSVYALDLQSGAIAWGPVVIGPPSGTGVYVGIAYENGRLFVATPVDSNGGLLRAFDAATGTQLWFWPLGGQWAFDAPPIALNGIVYVIGAGYEATIYAFTTDGTPLWTHRETWLSETFPAVTSTGLYLVNPCMAWDFDPKTGATVWWNAPSCNGGGATTPVLSGNALYTRTSAVGNAVVDPQTGALLGTYSADRSPAIFGSLGFFPLGTRIMAEDLATNTVDWHFDGDGSLVNGPLVINGNVYVASSTGKLYALRAGDGLMKWSDDVKSAIPRSEASVLGLPNSGLSAGENRLLVPALNRLVAYAPCTTACASAPVPPPVVTSIDPTGGGGSGGTYVFIHGSGFTGATGVKFGDVAASTVAVNTDSTIVATSPPGSGTVDITVTTPIGTSAISNADRFTYTPPPIITSVVPDRGSMAGGTRVTVTGTRLGSTYRVFFGSSPGTNLVVSSDTLLQVTSPPGAGIVDIWVIASNGTSGKSAADQFAYLAPPVVSIGPTTGRQSSGAPPPVPRCRCPGPTVGPALSGHSSPAPGSSVPPLAPKASTSQVQLAIDQLILAIMRSLLRLFH